MLARSRRWWRAIRFYASYPKVLFGFYAFRRQQMKRWYPTVWRSSGQLMREDLSYYEPPEGDTFFSQSTLDNFTNGVDRLNERIAAGMKVNFIVFVFLLAQYLSINMDLSIFGISIKNAPGVTESLLLFIGLSSFMQVVRQRNVYMLDQARKAIIHKIVPEEIRSIYLARYLPNEQFGPYFPFNLPHITVTPISTQLNSASLLGIIAAVIVPVYILYTSAYVLVVANLWFNPSLGWVSKAICIYLIVLALISGAYLARYQFYMPMRDFTTNHRLQIAEQFSPTTIENCSIRFLATLGESTTACKRWGIAWTF